MVKVLCVSCCQQYTVNDAWIGRKVKCSVCGHCFVAEAAATCSECGELNLPGAAVCRGCQAGLTPVQLQEAPDFQKLYESYGFRNKAAYKPEKVTVFTAFKRYDDFSGRASRKEFWLFWLFVLALRFILTLAVILFFGESVAAAEELATTLEILLTFALLLPMISALVRRLHDTGRSGWWLLFGLIPILGGIMLLIWLCENSQYGTNIYGENPKGEN